MSHWSASSFTPSPSESLWLGPQPEVSAVSVEGVFAHWSPLSPTPSPSESVVSDASLGKSSSESGTPSPSASEGGVFVTISGDKNVVPLKVARIHSAPVVLAAPLDKRAQKTSSALAVEGGPRVPGVGSMSLTQLPEYPLPMFCNLESATLS